MLVKYIVAFLLSLVFIYPAPGQRNQKPSGSKRVSKTASKPSPARINAALSKTQAVLQNQSIPPNTAIKALSDKNANIDKSFGSKDPKVWAQQWIFSRGVLEAYYAANKDNLLVGPFADVLRTLHRLSYSRRAEAKNVKNTFAKDFVRELFLYAALDISARWGHWQNPLTNDEEGVVYQKLTDCNELSFAAGFLTLLGGMGKNPNAATGVTLSALMVCRFQIIPATATGFVGDHHFDEHLAPGFYKHFHQVFLELAEGDTAGSDKAILINKFQKIIESIRREHTEQLEVNKQSYGEVADLPGFDYFSAYMAIELIPPRAAVLRESMFETAIVDLREEGKLDPQVANSVLAFLAGIPSGAKKGDNFLIGRYLNTRLRVERGESISIKAGGTIKVSRNPLSPLSSPKGMKEYENYSLVRKYPHGALMARVLHSGKEEWQLVGESRRIIAADFGILELMVNDGDPGNNTGAYTVNVSIGPNQNAGKDDEKKTSKQKNDVSKDGSKPNNKDQKDSKAKKALKNIWEKIKKP